MKQNHVTVCDNASLRLKEVIERCAPDRAVILTDENVADLYLPTLGLPADLPIVTISPGEEHKSLASLQRVWDALEEAGATRRSLLINVGGGLVTDLGGFAAATFRRGIRFLNVATTLLAAVDASVGGKTGVNYAGLKNEIGAFAWPEETIVDVAAFATLPREEILSGIGEIYKTAFIAPEDADMAGFICAPDEMPVVEAVKRSVSVKTAVVEADPCEKGLRRVLNFGHTAGHAFEELSFRTGSPLPHGIAVAYGILPALVLSHLRLGLPTAIISRYASLLSGYFPPLNLNCKDYPELLALIHRDKKNVAGAPARFTLLHHVGEPHPGVEVPDSEIEAALDISRDYLGI